MNIDRVRITGDLKPPVKSLFHHKYSVTFGTSVPTSEDAGLLKTDVVCDPDGTRASWGRFLKHFPNCSNKH